MSELANSPDVVQLARDRENVMAGDELVRHKLSSRVMHWTVALFFVVCLLTGMPIWSPVFGWMAYFFGGLTVCRWLHAWSGVGFAVASVWMTLHWAADMKIAANEKHFSMLEYLKFSSKTDPETGKYNVGQKRFFWTVLPGMLLVLLTGIPLWWPENFGWRMRQICLPLHDVGFILWFVAIVGHIYLGTAAEPGTFRSMVGGTVTKAWAKLHHPRWYREVTERERVS
jgi:formate dehydrogenase subunit gamma